MEVVMDLFVNGKAVPQVQPTLTIIQPQQLIADTTERLVFFKDRLIQMLVGV